MAYARHHDPYVQAPQHGLAPDYPPVPVNHNQYDYDPNWETKSAHSIQSSFHGSQAHLNSEYNMSRPNLHYQTSPVNYNAYQPNYPPVQSPHMVREMSLGYSVAREKLMKRRSVRQVELQNGNLVLDVPVPSHIIPKTMSHVEEMTKMRYTAATCDPDDFMRKKYSLRPYLYGRHTELFIVMTMYNEDEVLFVKTMNAVIKNIAHLCSRNRSKTWGPDGWKK
ncbi:chitin synthase N-terminal-domain-containing protein [Boletus reticuloceps]|uniref:Chitin synthase n=1 Tax=Boletus reticuloceps TaxID=495285 RepID=A0A8I2YWX6_9AGAM|nr:chitin synthase N-terminal-domain-containing protein [Boletus reticuloceps]